MNTKNKFFTVFLSAVLLFASCNNFLIEKNDEYKGLNGDLSSFSSLMEKNTMIGDDVDPETAAFVSFDYFEQNNDDASRTATPVVTAKQLTSFTVTYKPHDDSEAVPTTIFNGATYNQACSQFIMQPGVYDFMVYASKTELMYVGYLDNVTIVAGANPLSFELKLVGRSSEYDGEGEGAIKITANIPTSLGASKVTAQLLKMNGTALSSAQELTYSRGQAVFTQSGIDRGQYMVEFKVYGPTSKFERAGGPEYITGPLLQYYRELTYVSAGVTSVSEITIDSLEQTYTITYVADGAHIAGKGTYTQKERFNLPFLYNDSDDVEYLKNNNYTYVYKPGFFSLGWYDNPEFTGDSIYYIDKGTTGNKTFYLKLGIEMREEKYAENSEDFITWNSGDKAKLYSKLEGQTEATWNEISYLPNSDYLSSNMSRHMATKFFTNEKGILSTLNYFVYPENFADTITDFTNVVVDFTGQVQTENGSDAHTADYDVVLGVSRYLYEDSRFDDLIFLRRVGAKTKFEFELPESWWNKTFTKMVYFNPHGVPRKGKINLQQAALQNKFQNYDNPVFVADSFEENDETFNEYQFALTLDNITPDEEGFITLYAVMPPVDLSEDINGINYSVITLVDTDGEYNMIFVVAKDFSQGNYVTYTNVDIVNDFVSLPHYIEANDVAVATHNVGAYSPYDPGLYFSHAELSTAKEKDSVFNSNDYRYMTYADAEKMTAGNYYSPENFWVNYVTHNQKMICFAAWGYKDASGVLKSKFCEGNFWLSPSDTVENSTTDAYALYASSEGLGITYWPKTEKFNVRLVLNRN